MILKHRYSFSSIFASRLSHLMVIAIRLLSDVSLSNCSALFLTFNLHVWADKKTDKKTNYLPQDQLCSSHPTTHNTLLLISFPQSSGIIKIEHSVAGYKQILWNMSIVNVAEENICIAVPPSLFLQLNKGWKCRGMEEYTSVSHILTGVKWWTGWLKSRFPVQPTRGLTSCC